MDTKVCKICQEEKKLEDFHRKQSGIGGRRSVCKICRSKKEYPNPRNKRWTEEQKLFLSQNYHVINAKNLQDKLNHSLDAIYVQAKKQGLTTPMHYLSRHPLYHTLERINSRCNNIKDKSFKDYGGRGINVVDYWNFQKNNKKVVVNNFIDYMESIGWKRGLEIDRINNNGNYIKGNIRCVTRMVNANNKRSNIIVNYKGENYTIAQLSRHQDCKVAYATLRWRIMVSKQNIFHAMTREVHYG